MKHFLRLFLALAILLPARGVLRSQETGSWDLLLDRYERICKSCLDLKAGRELTGQIPDGRMLQLLSELGALKDELQEASPGMPVVARLRYEAIREMYTSGKLADTRQALLPEGYGIKAPVPPLPAIITGLNGSFPVYGIAPSVSYRYSVSFSSLVIPEFTPGVRASWAGRKAGAYVSFHSNFGNHHPSYTALSDGTAGDALVWASGNTGVDRLFLAAGPVLPLSDYLSLYAGAGYGFRRLCWEDTDGVWMEVADASHRGICIEAGANCSFGRLTFGAGVLSLPFSYNALTASVGISFGRIPRARRRY
jgi:hypothetical protein